MANCFYVMAIMRHLCRCTIFCRCGRTVGGPRSQLDTAKMKRDKRGDVQNTRKVTESAAGGRRPITVTGKSQHLHQNTCLRVLYSNVDSVLNKRAELLVCLQLPKPVIVALVDILAKNLRYPAD